MTAIPTHWIEYGEPTGNDRVEATKVTTYETGPNESRDRDVTHGTLAIETLEMWENDDEVSYHVHEDGSLMLSGLSDEKREEVLATWEPDDGRVRTEI